MNVSNKWTVEALKGAGMEIRPMFKLTAGSAMSYLEDVFGLLYGGSAANKTFESCKKIASQNNYLSYLTWLLRSNLMVDSIVVER